MQYYAAKYIYIKQVAFHATVSAADWRLSFTSARNQTTYAHADTTHTHGYVTDYLWEAG